MKDSLARLYHSGRITEAYLDAAVAKGWITEQDKQDIIDGYTGTYAAPQA